MLSPWWFGNGELKSCLHRTRDPRTHCRKTVAGRAFQRGLLHHMDAFTVLLSRNIFYFSLTAWSHHDQGHGQRKI